MKRAKKAKKPAGAGARAKSQTPSFSTSEGRKNFARALETTDKQKTVVGFARYRTPVAALVPIEAVQMLAGHGGEVEAGVRDHIGRMAKLFMTATAGASVAEKPAKKAAAKKKAPAKAKAKAKRGRRSSMGK